jgi:hypothetical protein
VTVLLCHLGRCVNLHWIVLLFPAERDRFQRRTCECFWCREVYALGILAIAEERGGGGDLCGLKPSCA